MLSVGLALAEDLCGVQLPAEVRPLIHSEKVNRICCEVKTGLFVEREPIVNLDRTLSFVRSRERLLDRIRILLRFIGPELRPNARDRALIHLPARLEVLYFPLRLVRLLLFCWRRAILPMLRGALDRTPIRHFSPIPPR
jgi:hypothetical protein